MRKYPKIDSVFKRDDNGRFTDEYSNDEFRVLQDVSWECTEKVDGTNIRVGWDADLHTVEIGGRTDKAVIQPKLLGTLGEIFTAEKFLKTKLDSMTLFGEGYGTGIQKPGKRYLSSGNGFILFDVLISDHLWLTHQSVAEIADNLEIKCVPVIGYLTIPEAIDAVSHGLYSRISEDHALQMEGMVLRAPCGLLSRLGRRIITKLKTRDFRND